MLPMVAFPGCGWVAVAVGTQLSTLSQCDFTGDSGHQGHGTELGGLRPLWCHVPKKANPVIAGWGVQGQPQTRPVSSSDLGLVAMLGVVMVDETHVHQ
jgi:hypothetical protein